MGLFGGKKPTPPVKPNLSEGYTPPPSAKNQEKPAVEEIVREESEEAQMKETRESTNGPKSVKGQTVEEATTFSHDQESTVVAERQSHLNSLFNGHLMKWKYEAEEGSPFIRIPVFFGALAMFIGGIVAIFLEGGVISAASVMMTVCIAIMSTLIIILEGRFLSASPLSFRAQLRDVVTRNFNMCRYLWGRSLIYLSSGILSVAQMYIITICLGIFMIFFGVVGLIVGINASRKSSALRNSLADESFLLLVFSTYDYDNDSFVTPDEFALILAELGMDLDDRYTLKAFSVIDTDNDRRISFEEFSHWWASGYIERGRKSTVADEEATYRRMS